MGYIAFSNPIQESFIKIAYSTVGTVIEKT